MSAMLEIHIRNLKSRIMEMRDQVDRWDKYHPRAMKLIRKGKNFLVVDEDEPYFFSVYTMVRNSEKEKGQWTHEDESLYILAMRKDQRKREA